MGRLAPTDGSLPAWVDGPRSKRFPEGPPPHSLRSAGSAGACRQPRLVGGPARRGRGRGRRDFEPTSRWSREDMEATPEATPVEADQAVVLGVVAAQPGRDAQDQSDGSSRRTRPARASEAVSHCLGQCLAAICMMICCDL